MCLWYVLDYLTLYAIVCLCMCFKESPLNLPCYQPKERTIDSFLAKVRSRQALRASRSSHGKAMKYVLIVIGTRS